MLHEMAAGVIDDNRVWDSLLSEFPGSQAGTLVSRSGLVDPDVNINSLLESRIDRRGCGTIVDKGEPTGIAMGENVDCCSSLPFADLSNDFSPMVTDAAAEIGILIGDGAGGIQASYPDSCPRL